MNEDRLITVAIHTYEKAVMLKTLLENEGVPVALHNVNLVQPVVSSGVRVRIKEKDLPLALRIIENTDIFANSETPPATHQKIIVPVDFSQHSRQAVAIAFSIAHRHKTSVIFLHSFIDQFLNGNIQLSNSLSYELDMSEMRQKLEAETAKAMKDFTSEVKTMIKNGEIPPVKFTTEIREGVPEDVITSYAKQAMPMLIAMCTRGSARKEKELIGSVTAEVLDTCRFPVLSLPETSGVKSLNDIKKITFFCNLDQDDILAMDALSRLFSDTHLEVTLIHPADKKHNANCDNSLATLTNYCTDHYHDFTFNAGKLSPKNITDEFRHLKLDPDHSLIVLPNKKKNIFSRLFNPSIAHKMLFSADIPMLVIPV